MPVSDVTIRHVIDVMKRHVGDDQLQTIMVDLLQVQGSQGFRDTIIKLANHLGMKVRYDDPKLKGNQPD